MPRPQIRGYLIGLVVVVLNTGYCRNVKGAPVHIHTQTHTKFAFLQLKNCNLSVQVSHGLWLWTAGLSCVSLPISGLQLFLETSLLKGTACADTHTHTQTHIYRGVCRQLFSATSYSCFQLSTNSQIIRFVISQRRV